MLVGLEHEKQPIHVRVRPTLRLPTGALVVAVFLALVLASPAEASAAGSLDTTFGSGGYATVSLGSSAEASAVAVQPDGKIVTAGGANVGGSNVIVSTRMTSTGTLDSSYGVGGIVTVGINGGAGVDSGAGLALQSDGKIVIAGDGRSGPGGPISFAAVRVLPDGSLDRSFGVGGVRTVPIGPEAIANAVVIQSDGKIVLAGTALAGHNVFAAVRLNADGTIDSSFGTGGTVTLGATGGAWGMVLQPDGKLVLAGQTDGSGGGNDQAFMATRLLANGTLDDTFGQAGIVTIPIGSTALGYGIALQSDGKLVLSGPAFTTTGVAATARLDPDGTLDPSFGSGGIATLPDWQGVNGIILDSAGRIVLPAVGASAVRLNTNGSADTSFGTGGIAQAPLGSHGGANGAAIQADGKIVLAGAADVNGQTVLTVIRLSAGPVPSDPIAPVVTTVVPPVDNLLMPAPMNTAAPVISGEVTEGRTLSSTTGVWSHGPTSIRYQWQRCDAIGDFCRDIEGAAASNYTTTGFDVGYALRVLATATNAGGSNAATSRSTATVGDSPSSAPALSRLHLTSASFGANRGTLLTVTVSEAAAITIRITRTVTGHRRRDLELTRRVAAGSNRFMFRLPGLRPGRYAGTITARNAAGQASKALTFVFTIRRPKRSR